ncbi:MAG: flagellar basal body P-ring formation chaperone FlgA [Candidatus Brocadiia bacterium]
MFSNTAAHARPGWVLKAAGVLLAAVAVRVSCAAGPVRIELKEAAVLQTAEIRLRQVADVSGDATLAADIGEVSLGSTPWPGNSRSVTKEQVARHLISAGFDVKGYEWRGAAACLVTLLTTKVTGEQIVQAGREYLASLPMLQRDDTHIEVEQTPRDCVVAGSAENVSLSAFAASADRPWGRLRIFVKIKVDDKAFATVPLMFMVTTNQKILVAARPINRGEVIEKGCLDTREIVLGPDSPQQTYLDPAPESAVGKVAVRSIPAGAALEASMVAEPLAIRRGEDVTLSLKSEHMEVVTKGIAQKDGYVGDLITVKVFLSGKDLTCKVVANGSVELPL